MRKRGLHVDAPPVKSLAAASPRILAPSKRDTWSLGIGQRVKATKSKTYFALARAYAILAAVFGLCYSVAFVLLRSDSLRALFLLLSGLAAAILYPSGLIGTLGSILLGVAIWRSATLSKYAGVLFAIHTPLLAFAPAFSYPLEVLGAACLLVSGLWLAAGMWRSAR